MGAEMGDGQARGVGVSAILAVIWRHLFLIWWVLNRSLLRVDISYRLTDATKLLEQFRPVQNSQLEQSFSDDLMSCSRLAGSFIQKRWWVAAGKLLNQIIS
jgi:hypothetical protein